MSNKYEGQNIAVRGVACSISSKPISIDGNLITNPAQILQLGAETSTTSSPMIGFKTEIPSRSLQWLIQHPQELRERAVAEGKLAEAQSIYPLLIVYDRDQFNPTDTNLPDDPEKRGKAIKEVIILDYPKSKQVFNNKV